MNHSVSGRATPEMYLQAQRLHTAKIVRTVYWVCATMAVVGLVTLLAGYRWGGLVLGGGVGGLLGVWVQTTFYVPYKLNKLAGQYKALSEDLTLSWDAQALTGKAVNGYGVRPWADFHKWKENQHVFLLYFNDQLYEFVPKAWFPSSAMVDDFRQCAAQIGPVKS